MQWNILKYSKISYDFISSKDQKHVTAPSIFDFNSNLDWGDGINLDWR